MRKTIRGCRDVAIILTIGLGLTYFFAPIASALNSQSVELHKPNQYLYALDSQSLSITSSLTVEMWAKFNSIDGQYGTLATKYGGGSNQRGYWFGYRDELGNKKFESRISSDGSGGNTSVQTLPYDLEADTWYHLVFVYTAAAGTVDVYVATTSLSAHVYAGTMSGHQTSIKDTTSKFMLGGIEGEEPGTWFDGTMDDVRVWNVARTQAQIDADFKTELTGSEPGLAAYWTFNGGSLQDLTANNNDFTAPQSFTQSAEVPFDDAPPPPPPADPDPVIIIPGILGSEQVDGVWKIDPILHTYDDLIATLDVNHYTPDVDLFTFPYNWRASNVDTALLLKQKIDEVKGICACDNVDLVAHSMGGLVARQYIQSDDYEDDVDQLIFLGTPHLGAPKSYLMWEAGETDLAGIRDRLFSAILRQEAKEGGYGNVFNYVQDTPIESVRELLPTYDYLFDGNVLRSYPTNYPTNPFLETLNSTIAALQGAGIGIHNIVGDTSVQKTITSISVVDPASVAKLPLWEHGYPENFDIGVGDRGLERGSGDGTVPLSSARYVPDNLTTVASEHNSLPDDTKAHVFEILKGEVPTTLVDNWTLVNARLLMIKIFSPADLLVIAPDGKKIGTENGVSINEIPGAFYTGAGASAEFITVLNPLDGEYTILTQGTGTGPYTVEASYITDEDATDASFSGNTTPGVSTQLNMLLDNDNPEGLEVLPDDVGSPVITITQPEARDYVRSEQLPVNVSAQDPSGVFTLLTLLGTTTIPNVGSVDLFFLKLGTTTITATADDTVGNSATTTQEFRIIATIDSTLSDIERAYREGWMTKKVHDTLRKKFNAVVKLSKIVGKTKDEKIQKVVDTVLAAAFLNELNKVRGKGLNEQAYQLLKEDVEWLLSH